MQKYKQFIFHISYLLIALVCGIISLGSRYVQSSQINLEEYRDKIQENIRRELNVVDGICNEILHQVEISRGPIPFSESNLPYKYPIFIFKNTDLVFWSEYNCELPYQLTQEVKTEACVELDNGTYLLKKNQISIGANSYIVAGLIPIYTRYSIENTYLKNGTNPEIFPIDNCEVNSYNEDIFNIYNNKGAFIFSYRYPDLMSQTGSKPLTEQFFGICAILLLLLQLRLSILRLLESEKSLLAFLLLPLGLIVVRYIMMSLNIPSGMINLEIFNPKIYASSSLAPSLGDLIIHLSFIFLWVSFCIVHFQRLILALKGLKMNINFRIVSGIICVFISFMGANALHFTLYDLYTNSQISFDMVSSLSFTTDRIIGLGVILLAGSSFFLITHGIGKIILTLKPSLYHLILMLLSGSILVIIVSLIFGFQNFFIIINNLLLLACILTWNLPSSLQKASYITLIYLIVGSAFCAFSISYDIRSYEQNRVDQEKKSQAKKLIASNDVFGEHLLNEINQKLLADPLVQTRFFAPFSPKDVLIKKISRYYMGSYFDKYDKNILLFDKTGKSMIDDTVLDSIKSSFISEEYKTNFPNIYLKNNLQNSEKQYFSLISIFKNGDMLGHILIHLKQVKVVSNSVYPNLLLDQRFLLHDPNQLSFAVYDRHKLISSSGNFNYDKDFLMNFPDYSDQYEYTHEKYKHLLLREENNKVLILTSELYPFERMFSNFSHQFLLHLVFLSVLFIIYRKFHVKESFDFTFATRIQVYLYLAFIIPLTIASILIISMLNNSNKTEDSKSYFERAEHIATSLAKELSAYTKSSDQKPQLETRLMEVAELTRSEINIFDVKGKLITSSQSKMFEYAILSHFVNPRAIADLVEAKQKKVLLNEVLGGISYSSAYVNVLSPESNEVIGIVGVPFFESRNRAEQEISRIISIIANIFTVSLISLSFLAFLVYQPLTAPLKMLTEKIQQTSLSGHNEPLVYTSKDEIGLLVREYNAMLVSLEESKSALSKSEKESAWREMAKQVAHEIKNPLTPMKLTIQQLQRVEKESPHINRAMQTLLNQIDTLSDIASSFSTFAGMPIPKEEDVRLDEILKQVLVLYQSNENITLTIALEEGNYLTKCDENLFSRIITNLILNGIQSVPQDRKAHIKVRLTTKKNGRFAHLEIEDNGCGIPDYLQTKIFEPSFTTKSTGSGIGLAVAKRGIEHSGGLIWFETEENVGTCFIIEMPLQKSKLLSSENAE